MFNPHFNIGIPQPRLQEAVPLVYDPTDEFFMYIFKIKRCPKLRSHDWTECPFLHKGEKARRRDPRKFHYTGIICAQYRNGSCRKGDLCEYAHGVFEYWLHPARYRTRFCNAGMFCQRKVCFFAHSINELRPSTKHKCNCHTRMDGCKRGTRFAESSSSMTILPNFSLAPSTSRENSVVINWDVLENLGKLRIEDVNEPNINNASDFPETDWNGLPHWPDINWVSELVAEVRERDG